MKTNILILSLLFAATSLMAQTYYAIIFTGTGANPSSVLVENLTKGTSVSLPGTDTLHLDLGTGIHEMQAQNGTLAIYPNPMDQSCTFEFFHAEKGMVAIRLFSVEGRQIHQYSTELAQGKHRFLLSGVPAGVYVISIISGGEHISGRFVSTAQAGAAFSLRYIDEAQSVIMRKGTTEQPHVDITAGMTEGSKSIVVMSFSQGDQLRFTGSATSFPNDTVYGSPTGNQTINFVFVGLATLTTQTITSITFTTAIGGGNVTNHGGYAISARGICWGTSQYPSLSNNYTNDGAGTGSFTSHLSGLVQGTTYYVRAYATNSQGTAYGNQQVFSTTSLALPIVSTASVTSITATSAQSGGNVTSDGGDTLTVRGVCWSTSPNPVVTGNHTTDGTGMGTFTSHITGLTANTTYYIRAYATNSQGTAYGNQQTFTTTTLYMPTVTTNTVTYVTSTSATCGGNVTSAGSSTVTARGVCWSTTQNPTTANNTLSGGSGTGSFTSNITGLTAGTTYYVRAFATNSQGTAYGNQLSFTTTTLSMPTVTTNTVTSVTSTSATCGGNVTSAGSSTVTARGVCWSTTQNPTTANNTLSGGSGTGSFTSSITGLTAGTTYYVRAYATNSQGTAYGNQQSFYTPALGSPTVTTTTVSLITGLSAQSGGNITSDGSSQVTARGVCWSTTPNPTTANNTLASGSGAGSYTSVFSGLTPGTTYYVRAYATNNQGTAYGNQQTFSTTALTIPTVTTTTVSSISGTSALCGGNVTAHGGATVSARGVCWSTGQNPTIADSATTDGTGTGSFSSNITGLSPLTTYYVRAYATNLSGTAYGNQFSFTTTSLSLPSVTTSLASYTTQTSVVIEGIVTNVGGDAQLIRGFCWSANQNPTLADSVTSDGIGVGSFSRFLSGLPLSTTYYVRAYATNSLGTVYGNQISFTTLSLSYGEVFNPTTGRIWMDKNLGATQVATSFFNTPAYGDLYQWGRGNDGHQIRTSLTTTNLSYGDNPMHGNFILTSNNPPYDWRSPQNTELWQGANGINNPCPTGYYVPSQAEWNAERLSWSSNDIMGAFSSVLKLPAAGFRGEQSGIVWFEGSSGHYWTSTVFNLTSFRLNIQSSTISMTNPPRGGGNSVRCIKNTNVVPTVSTASVIPVSYNSAIGGGVVISEGTSPVIARGVCVSHTTNPSLANSFTTDGEGLGSFMANISGLNQFATYYVRAYATNSSGTGYGNQVSFAPNPNINQGEVMNPATGNVWMDRNLGASSVANSPNDTASFGHLYQWGRNPDGHQLRTSSTTNTLSNSNITAHGKFIINSNNPLDWLSVQDTNLWQGINGVNNPCPAGFRLPTSEEWHAERLTWSGANTTGAFNSPLRLPTAGNRSNNGSINLYSGGVYWSSKFNTTHSIILLFTPVSVNLGISARVEGASVRCIKEYNGLAIPKTQAPFAVVESSANCSGNVLNDGGNPVTARGVCWNTSPNPTISNPHTSSGSGTGSYNNSMKGLNPGTTYYVRAYATNSAGTAYGNQVVFTTPLGISQGDVLNSVTGKYWMDRNLGASQVATSSTNSNAYGALFQWGRAADGHQIRTSTTTTNLSSTNTPGHASFIIPITNPHDWRSPQNDNLWQGLFGLNNPCPNGYRIPTEPEWESERLSWGGNNSYGAYQSPLKLTVAGARDYSNGSVFNEGSFGFYWSSTVDGYNSRNLVFSNNAQIGSNKRAFGMSVRCIKDNLLHASITTTAVNTITQNAAICGGNVASHGGTTVSARGVCWSTTQNPTVANSHTTNGGGSGSFSSSLSGLLPSTTYYIRAYATNSAGTAYGNQLSFTTTALSIPTITTNAHSYVNSTSAVSGGKITNDGGLTITAHGVCWNTSPNPTIANLNTNDGFGGGSFSSNITGLTAATTYYVRAYATNSQGTAYGNQISFTTPTLPTVTTTAASSIMQFTAVCGGNVLSNGGTTVFGRGICYSTQLNPTIADSVVIGGSGTGSFSVNLTGLTLLTIYFARAFATNSEGTVYGNLIVFATVGMNSGEVLNPVTQRIWMDKNLGASQVATSSTHSASYGDLYQWGRGTDGHQLRTSPTIASNSQSDTPGHNIFLLVSTSPHDWRNPQNNNLWQGVNGINNPCPVGFRLPTEAEWNTERLSWSTNNAAGAFASPLKLPVAGTRSGINGSLTNVGSGGYYWSSTVTNNNSRILGFSSFNAYISYNIRAHGYSVRCIKD